MPSSEAQITYEEQLQSEQILVKSTVLTDEQLRCLSTVERAPPYPIVTFENAELTKRHYELQHQQARADAREWLRTRGLLASLPSYDPRTESVAEFARRVEEFCGIEPGSILMVHEVGLLTIKPEWNESQLFGTAPALSENKFRCLMNSISASNLEDEGVDFGIVGNAYVADEKQP